MEGHSQALGGDERFIQTAWIGFELRAEVSNPSPFHGVMREFCDLHSLRIVVRFIIIRVKRYLD
jgi:hypothetical protein